MLPALRLYANNQSEAMKSNTNQAVANFLIKFDWVLFHEREDKDRAHGRAAR